MHEQTRVWPPTAVIVNQIVVRSSQHTGDMTNNMSIRGGKQPFPNAFLIALLSVSICHVCRSRRGLYNKCVCDGDLQRDRMGYTNLEQKSPAAIFFVGLVVVVLAGLLGLQGNSKVTLGLELMFTSERGRPTESSVFVRYLRGVLIHVITGDCCLLPE